ncbi:hypothetical protein [Streptomyces sp. NBC_01233]|uniref:hypothetical protein n=1 Tax=Streptomyces sp. NBC_01233 TaxID=2903787 RepID=UPI002E127ECF|nr:hypothetical protein OG332_29645 [Streptomyces sp. NBC_01233]
MPSFRNAPVYILETLAGELVHDPGTRVVPPAGPATSAATDLPVTGLRPDPPSRVRAHATR